MTFTEVNFLRSYTVPKIRERRYNFLKLRALVTLTFGILVHRITYTTHNVIGVVASFGYKWRHRLPGRKPDVVNLQSLVWP